MRGIERRGDHVTARDLKGVVASTLRDFSPASLFPTLATGLISGVILVTLTISLAALIFRGDLADGLPLGIGISLFATLVIGVVSVFGSGLAGTVAGVQDNTAAVIGAAAAAIAADVASPQAIPTVIAFMFVASATTALVLGGLGSFRLGSLVQYVPYPVVGGFLVATGILILDGALAILLQSPDGAGVWSADSIWRWIPGIGIGLTILGLSRHRRSRTLLPWIIVGTIVGVHGALAVAGIARSEAVDSGWLLGGFGDAALWQPDVLRLLGDADWSAVVAQAGALGTVVAIAAMSLMIKVHALDQATGEDLDVDRELTVAGVATAAVIPGAGMPGYMHFSQTLLLRGLAGPRRGPALVAALTAGIVLLAGSSILSLVPTALVGGLLLYLGANFLVEWLWDRRGRLALVDYALVVGAGAAVVVLGFLPAIGIGTVVAILLFVVRYSRVDAVRHSYTLRVFRSSIERSPAQAAILEEEGDCAVVLEVHGFLFFGTAHGVFGDPRLFSEASELRHAVFDLTRVTGIDSSTSTALAKLARRSRTEGFDILLAGLPTNASELTAQLSDADVSVHQFDSLDDAAEWCEERILDEHTTVRNNRPNLAELLAATPQSRELARTALAHFERIELDPGDAVIEQGTASAGLYLIESGTLTAQLKTADGKVIRLRTMQPGTLLGEISLYQGGATTADVLAEEAAVVLHLSVARLQQIEETDPSAAALIHRLASRTLAGRVIHAERALRTFRK
ncbi:MAG: cyclic nucleotide-binding domain-containing protein [Acidimicrobiia bacterium]|nr:cyclic nucleotide-binding domain-containing protein [Acidimicrobiia bacterium]